MKVWRERKTKSPFQTTKTSSDWQQLFKSMPFTIFVLTMTSFLMDVFLYARNGAFFHSFGYSIILLIYAYGWSLALWCGRGVVFFCLIFNFIVFCVFKEYYKVNIDPLDFYAIQSAYQEGIRAGFSNWRSLLDTSFWVMAGVTMGALIWITQRSFMNWIRLAWVCLGTGIIGAILAAFDIFKWLGLSLFLFPNLYTSYEQGLLYKITFPIESVTQNPMLELDRIVLPGNQQQVDMYQTDNMSLSRMPAHIYVIQAESFTTIPLTPKVMPFLTTRLKQSSVQMWTDEKHYHCLGSANTDFMMMTGLDLNCTRNHMIVYFKYPPTIYEEIQTLPARLQQQGYQTYFLHGYEALFFNRIKHYPAMGFDHVTFMENFAPRFKRGEWGVSDKDVLLTAIAQTQKKDKTFAFIITASMHPPYEALSDSVKPYPNPQTETETYLNAASELDTALQLFNAHLPDDSLVFLYGDHNAPDVGGFDTPLIVWYKGQNPPEWPTQKQAGFQQTIYYINSVLTSSSVLPKNGKEK